MHILNDGDLTRLTRWLTIKASRVLCIGSGYSKDLYSPKAFGQFKLAKWPSLRSRALNLTKAIGKRLGAKDCTWGCDRLETCSHMNCYSEYIKLIAQSVSTTDNFS
jgi:hypothetical protein